MALGTLSPDILRGQRLIENWLARSGHDYTAVMERIATAMFVLGSSSRETLLAISSELGIDEAHIYRQDAEYAVSVERVPEPQGLNPEVPAIFKNLQMIDHLRLAFITQMLREDTEGIYTQGTIQLLATNDEQSERNKLVIEGELSTKSESQLDEKLANTPVGAGDIVVLVNGIEQHKLVRDAQQPDISAKEFEPYFEVATRHKRPTDVEWRCATSVLIDGQLKTSHVIIRAEEYPALSPHIVYNNFNCRVNGGVALLEAAAHYPNTKFTISNVGSDEKLPIVREKALWIIAKKWLPSQLFEQLRTQPGLETEIDGAVLGRASETITYSRVTLDLQQAEAWLQESSVQSNL